MIPTLDGLDDVSDDSHDIILRTSPLVFFPHFFDAGPPLFTRDTCTTDHLSLFLPHTSVDINILRSDEQLAVLRPGGPAVNLPTQE